MTETLDESKRNRRTAKRILAIGLPLVLIGSVGLGYAYWTSPGTGGGTATTATNATGLTIGTVTSPSNLAPGVAAGAVSVSVSNANAVGTGKVQANQVVVSVASVTTGSGTGPACTTSDYTVTNGTMTVGAAELAPGQSTTFTGASLGFNDTGSNQDNCKGATVTLAYALS